jgi:hypothetical protein
MDKDNMETTATSVASSLAPTRCASFAQLYDVPHLNVGSGRTRPVPSFAMHTTTRAEAEELLNAVFQPGSFIARPAGSRADAIALSLKRVDGRVTHHAVDQVSDGTYRFDTTPINAYFESHEAAVQHVVDHSSDFINQPDSFRTPVPSFDVSEL